MDFEFFIKFENRSMKTAQVNSILITKSMNIQLFTFFMVGWSVVILCDFQCSVHL